MTKLITNYDEAWWDERLDTITKESGGEYSNEKVLSLNKSGTYIFKLLPLVNKSDLFRQYGAHWNVFPEGEWFPKGPIGCPKINWAEPCVLCDAADEAIVTGRANRDEIYGMQKWGVIKRFMVRGVLQKFAPESPSEVLKITELPALVHILLPIKVQKAINTWMRSGIEDIDSISAHEVRKMLFDLDDGYPLRITRSSKIDQWYTVEMGKKPYSVPEEFRDPDQWPEMESLLPPLRSNQLKGLITKYIDDVPMVVSSYIERENAIDVVPERKALPPITEEDLKRTAIEDLEKQLEEL